MSRPPDAVEPQEAYEALAKAMPERELQELVRKAALDRDYLFYHPWRSDNSASGFPDCVAIRGDRIIYIELKREGKDLEPAQIEWRDALVYANAEYHTWRPGDWFSGAIQDILDEE